MTVEPHENDEPVGRERTTYDYDANGVRVRATKETDGDLDGEYGGVNDSGSETEYLIDSRNPTLYAQILQEVTRDLKTQSVTDQRIYTLGMDVISQASALPGSGSAGSPLVLLYDGHGSTRHVADLNAAIQESYIYDAYGNAVNFDPATALTHLLYSGESFDSRIGQQYLRARWYDPLSGRFNRLDPFAGDLKNPQSLHKYLYGHADPVTHSDPTGLFSLGSTLGSASIGSGLRGMSAAQNIQTGLNFGRLLGFAAIGGTWLVRSTLMLPRGPLFLPAWADADAFILSLGGSISISTAPFAGPPTSQWLPFGNTGVKFGAGLDLVIFSNKPDKAYLYSTASAGLAPAGFGIDFFEFGFQWGNNDPDEYDGKGWNASFSFFTGPNVGNDPTASAFSNWFRDIAFNLHQYAGTGWSPNITMTQGSLIDWNSTIGIHISPFGVGGNYLTGMQNYAQWKDRIGYAWSFTWTFGPHAVAQLGGGGAGGAALPPPPLAGGAAAYVQYAIQNEETIRNYMLGLAAPA